MICICDKKDDCPDISCFHYKPHEYCGNCDSTYCNRGTIRNKRKVECIKLVNDFFNEDDFKV